MTEEQQIEVWRNEYFKLTGEISGHSAKWAGFLLAKRSMAAIEIPSYDLHHYAPVRNITAQMDAAGIKYKIKV